MMINNQELNSIALAYEARDAALAVQKLKKERAPFEAIQKSVEKYKTIRTQIESKLATLDTEIIKAIIDVPSFQGMQILWTYTKALEAKQLLSPSFRKSKNSTPSP